MGPLKVLLSLGANIIAVDINRPGVWEFLITSTLHSCGTLTFPMAKEMKIVPGKELYENCGCDLMAQPAEICNWLKYLYPGQPFVVGGYAYLDGLLHVKLAIAMDAIMDGLIKTRGNSVTLAFLCTPTDVHMIPKAAHEAAKFNLAHAPFWQKMLMGAGVNHLKSNVVKQVKNETLGKEFYLVDGITVAQGPNYALAKRLQHWRAIVARSSGITVSTNIAPSTKTASVVSNVQFKAAYEGMPAFIPMEIMFQDTSNSVMGALLLHDVYNHTGKSHYSTKLDHPMQLFSYYGFHGGVWRCGFTINSIGLYSALIYYFGIYKIPVFIVTGASIAVIAYIISLGFPHNWCC